MEVKYGQFLSEKNNPKYSDTHHFWVLIERDGFHLASGYTNYSYSCHFTDVAIHFHTEKSEGDKCTYSPTGFCNCYDQIRWDSFGNKISDHVATEILIERIQEALSKNKSFLHTHEADEIRQELFSFEIWGD